MNLLTVNEVADLLKLNQQTIRNMIDRGARRVRIRQSQLDAFLAAGETGPQAQQSDPWQAVTEAAGRAEAAVRAHDRHALDCALSSLVTATQEVPAQSEAGDAEPGPDD
jgi:excisionase family DNA binding protein